MKWNGTSRLLVSAELKSSGIPEIIDRLSKPKVNIPAPREEILFVKPPKLLKYSEDAMNRLSIPRTFESTFSRLRSISDPIKTQNPEPLERKSIDDSAIFKSDIVGSVAVEENPYASRQSISTRRRCQARASEDSWLALNFRAVCENIIRLSHEVEKSKQDYVDKLASEKVLSIYKDRAPVAERATPLPFRVETPSHFPKLSAALQKAFSQRPTRVSLLRLCRVASFIKHA